MKKIAFTSNGSAIIHENGISHKASETEIADYLKSLVPAEKAGSKLNAVKYENGFVFAKYENGKKFKKALTAYLRQRIGEHKIKKFKFTDSRKDNLIQLADIVVGAVARSYSDMRKDANRWLDVLKRRDKIKSIWDFK